MTIDHAFFANSFGRVAKCGSSYSRKMEVPEISSDGTALITAWRRVFANMVTSGDWSVKKNESFTRVVSEQLHVPLTTMLNILDTFAACAPQNKKPKASFTATREYRDEGFVMNAWIDALFVKEGELWVFTLSEAGDDEWLNADAIAATAAHLLPQSKREKFTVFLIPLLQSQEYWDARIVSESKLVHDARNSMKNAALMDKMPPNAKTYRVGSHCQGCRNLPTCAVNRLGIGPLLDLIRKEGADGKISPDSISGALGIARSYERTVKDFRMWVRQYVKDHGNRLEDQNTGTVAVVTTQRRGDYVVKATTFETLKITKKGKVEEE